MIVHLAPGEPQDPPPGHDRFLVAPSIVVEGGVAGVPASAVDLDEEAMHGIGEVHPADAVVDRPGRKVLALGFG